VNVTGDSGVSGKSRLPTELDFLTSLEEGTVVTQMTLSKRVAVSVGLINALLKRAMHKGYVKAKAAPYKRYAYYLTPKGFSEKSRLVSEYLEVSLSFFRSARQEYLDLFARAHASGIRKVAFVGCGELAEIALIAAREAEIEVDSVFDDRTNRERFAGLVVLRVPQELKGFDAVVITDARTPQDAFDRLSGNFADQTILAPRLLRITRARLDFKSEAAVP
jgi:hypothetical protein